MTGGPRCGQDLRGGAGRSVTGATSREGDWVTSVPVINTHTVLSSVPTSGVYSADTFEHIPTELWTLAAWRQHHILNHLKMTRRIRNGSAAYPLNLDIEEETLLSVVMIKPKEEGRSTQSDCVLQAELARLRKYKHSWGPEARNRRDLAWNETAGRPAVEGPLTHLRPRRSRANSEGGRLQAHHLGTG